MVFGPAVDSYTMKESADDGITMCIAYEPRLARVQPFEQHAKGIQKYYDKCAAEGSTPEQIEESQRAMSSLSVILRHPDRLKKLARDLVERYEALCSKKPDVVQRAMVVCPDRKHAYEFLKEIVAFCPDWVRGA